MANRVTGPEAVVKRDGANWTGKLTSFSLSIGVMQSDAAVAAASDYSVTVHASKNGQRLPMKLVAKLSKVAGTGGPLFTTDAIECDVDVVPGDRFTFYFHGDGQKPGCKMAYSAHLQNYANGQQLSPNPFEAKGLVD